MVSSIAIYYLYAAKYCYLTLMILFIIKYLFAHF